MSDILKSFLDKVSNFFNVFDLSFFVSGCVSWGVILFLCSYFDYAFYEKICSNGIMGIIASYCLGLLCFAIGRKMRKVYVPSKDFFLEAFNKTELAQLDEYKKFQCFQLPGNEKIQDMLFSYCWVKIRENKKMEASYSFINRYWVMTAIYDGVSVSLLLWVISVSIIYFNKIGANNSVPESSMLIFEIAILVISVVLFLACIKEHLRIYKLLMLLFVFTVLFLFFVSWVSGLNAIHQVVGIYIAIVVICLLFVIIVMRVCYDEANRYYESQVKELISTLLYIHNNQNSNEEGK